MSEQLGGSPQLARAVLHPFSVVNAGVAIGEVRLSKSVPAPRRSSGDRSRDIGDQPVAVDAGEQLADPSRAFQTA